MFKSYPKILSVMAGMLLTANSFAGLIVDTVSQSQYVGWWQSASYTHDLTDGLNQTSAFTLGSAIGGSLAVNISDDKDKWWEGWETILFTVEEFDFDTGGITFGSGFLNDLEVEALGALNADGMLDVTVTSLWGDFYLGDSVLTVETADVPEPGSLALLGLGLAGLGLSRRRLKS